MRRIIVFLVQLLLVLPHLTQAESLSSAPFGLSWGMTTQEVKSVGANLSLKKTGQHGEQYVATSLPKVVSDMETVMLFFGYNNRLWRIAAVSKPFENDPYGSGAKARYEKLSNILAKKYGKGEQYHHQSEMWSEPDEFVMGLKSGRSWYYTNYQTEEIEVQLALRGFSSDTAVYILIYVHKELKKSFEKGKEAKESESL